MVYIAPRISPEHCQLTFLLVASGLLSAQRTIVPVIPNRFALKKAAPPHPVTLYRAWAWLRITAHTTTINRGLRTLNFVTSPLLLRISVG